MKLPSRRARIALLAGCATFAVAAPASATVTSTYSTDPDGTLTAASSGADPITITCEGGFTKVERHRSGPRAGPRHDHRLRRPQGDRRERRSR